MVNFSNGLVKRGIQVDSLARSADGPFRSLLSDQVNIITLGHGMLRSIPKLRKYLRNSRPDILFSSQAHINLAAILSKLANPTPTRIVIREATTPSIYAKHLASWKKKFIMFMCRRLFKRADHVIGVSDDSREDCISYYGLNPDRITRIYSNLITEEDYNKANEPLEHPWFQDDSRVIISMGRIMPVKGFENLLRAFSMVRKNFNCRLMIVGETSRDTDYFDSIQKLVAELEIAPDVDFVGFQNNPFPYLKNSEVYVLSSKFEGLPGALVQGMAMGCKLISTRCKSGPREILADGKRGQLVPVGDSNALATAIEDVLNQEHDRTLGKKWAAEFSEEVSLERLLETFEKIMVQD